MKAFRFLIVIFLGFICIRSIESDNQWIIENHNSYKLFYTSVDRKNIKEYSKLIENGIISVKEFFNSTFDKEFDVVIHPNRNSLDSSCQHDWNMPEFKSECWMVASGVATRLDMISPKMWDKEACEHIYKEKQRTQNLVSHELVHVFHGQLNRSPDFSNTEGIDWFIEGLATYASGQLDSLRINEIKQAISENKIPTKSDDFWKGKLRYGLSGSLVMFIDKKYGRASLIELLPFNKKSELFSNLNTTEPELLDGWKRYIETL
jgi:hypothetical protein